MKIEIQPDIYTYIDNAVIRVRVSDCTRAFVYTLGEKPFFFPFGEKKKESEPPIEPVIVRFYSNVYRDLPGLRLAQCATENRISITISRITGRVSRNIYTSVQRREGRATCIFARAGFRRRNPPVWVVDQAKNLVRRHVTGLFFIRDEAYVARIIYEITGDYGKRDSDIKLLVLKTDCCVAR